MKGIVPVLCRETCRYCIGSFPGEKKMLNKLSFIRNLISRRLIPVLALLASGILLTACGQKNEPLLHPVLRVEAGGELPQAADFLAVEEKWNISGDFSNVNTAVPGVYPVTVICDEVSYPVNILVEDTTEPVAQIRELTADYRELPQPEDFITQIWDATPVTVDFGIAPTGDVGGIQEITLVLTDAAGNVTTLNVILTVIRDIQAPEILGVKDITLYQGGTVAYRSGVAVTDDQDENPVLSVDSSGVDLSTPGVYEVKYRASDASGNSSEKTAAVTVLEKKADYAEMETVFEMGRQILEEIIQEGMTDREKVVAIYRYIRQNHWYTSRSDSPDWYQGAYDMMTKHVGNCYNYFALCKLLLELEGIPNIDVVKLQRYSGDSRHFWSLVSVDGGETYYHVDTTPRNRDPIEFLLVTDAYMDAYSAKHYNCFNRDMSLYPATPEE